MKIKDFTVGQVVYAFSYEDIALLKGLKPKKYTVAKIGRKYLYAARGEEVNMRAQFVTAPQKRRKKKQ